MLLMPSRELFLTWKIISFFNFVGKEEGDRKRSRKRERDGPSAGLIPACVQHSGLVQAEAGGLEPNVDVGDVGDREPHVWIISCSFPGWNLKGNLDWVQAIQLYTLLFHDDTCTSSWIRKRGCYIGHMKVKLQVEMPWNPPESLRHAELHSTCLFN